MKKDVEKEDREIHYGMAFSAMSMTPSGIREYLDFPEFSVMELPWETIVSPDRSLLREAVRREKTVICGGIMDSRLSQTIPLAEKNLRKSFSEQLEKALLLLAGRGIRTAALECSMESVLGNINAEHGLQEILHAVAPVMLRENMTLLLPCPLPSNIPASEYSRFLRNTLLPCIKLRLDVHPWQMTPAMTPQGITGTLRLETRALTFRYDADCGNRILPAHVKDWKAYFSQLALPCTFLLCPYSRMNRMAYPEANQFAEIIRDSQD